jgi:hypothetical protein
MALKRDEIADPNSCLNRAADDEPIFILRAKDQLTPKLVRDWAAKAAIEGHHEIEKIEAAWKFADRMDAWRRAHFPERTKVA